ncbi:MAG: hypothetical protein A2V70_11050 [Planctomycetes bacterium RBG_13_63_9]|nr:MAG: hypothetical protein A2V70_11050 [Planctomycetes bacterium RBG_13_63_9]
MKPVANEGSQRRMETNDDSLQHATSCWQDVGKFVCLVSAVMCPPEFGPSPILGKEITQVAS